MLFLASMALVANASTESRGFLDFGTENPYREFNNLINSYFFKYTHLESTAAWGTKTFGEHGGYYFNCYLRDLVGGTLVYWITATVWHIVIYKVLGNKLFHSKGRPLPTTETIMDQMLLAQSSLFVYAALPVFSEFLIENGITHTYFYVSDIGGWVYYAFFLFIYITLVEIGIYWMHRTLHENKFLYKYVHGLHHKYNKHQTLTPWCSIAFNPIDGILQACPYVICLFIVPVHYFTHVFLLFFSGVWATNIHDALVSCLFILCFHNIYANFYIYYLR
jgi:Delta7-sterol 5-desaturase